ncbi:MULTISPECIES: MerR family transcriptional regulator [unclassified Sporolactobacillus]|uniref:MerR family transcriptional regulator n=1 Tax=unclassified Sporolactobacillus TaxID=2628533 RepID=UPI002368E4F6|nr:MerR family transcriptional regulator [Sporolactobacillus sp. CQH2019]MDD9147246.1 MerR family transcriptional regulator [Sporolactobacillus sp. CQH2019]
MAAHSQKDAYLFKKVISIGTVCELTGLSERQIRYYEKRKLIFPERSDRGNRKYSFTDVETLMEIADKMEDGMQTSELRREMLKKQNKRYDNKFRERMIRGQLNAYFNKRD